MKNKITNVSKEDIILFVKREDIEEQVEIPSGQSLIVDDYETKTIRIFSRKRLITVESASLSNEDCNILKGRTEEELQKEENNAILDATERTMTDIDLNSDEVMDDFHTTVDHEAVLVDGGMKAFQENLMKSLTNSENATKLDVVEGEVEQYVEDGFVKGEWSDEDTIFLKKNYPTKGRVYCSTHLNRNETSVQKKINALGLKKKKKRK